MRIIFWIFKTIIKIALAIIAGLVIGGWLYERRMANDPGAKWYRECCDRNAAENEARRANTAK
jgi:hypothetical protein